MNVLHFMEDDFVWLLRGGCIVRGCIASGCIAGGCVPTHHSINAWQKSPALETALNDCSLSWQ